MISANVLEHVPDGEHDEILSCSFDVLRPGGYSVHWVPAFESIYGSLDRLFLHHRRYKKRQLCSLFEKAGSFDRCTTPQALMRLCENDRRMLSGLV